MSGPKKVDLVIPCAGMDVDLPPLPAWAAEERETCESGPGIEALPMRPVCDMSEWMSDWDLLPEWDERG
jgi:hypothetical protein